MYAGVPNSEPASVSVPLPAEPLLRAVRIVVTSWGSCGCRLAVQPCLRVREAWPNVRIHVRGDGGFGNPTMYEVCERLEITYTFGLSTDTRRWRWWRRGS
jgi:hypothetical protein